MSFERHPIRWTPEKVERFWAWLSTSQPDEAYFARAHGREILAFAQRHGVLRGRALDFGSGPGFLVEHLLAAGLRTTALDLSAESLARVERRFSGNPSFEGTHHAKALPTSLSPAQFDVAFLLETVEHLDDDQLRDTLAEIVRLLRPGGAVVVTTPNRENLQARTVMCPDCGCEFHRVQHVRSFSAQSLASELSRAGLRVAAHEETSLGGSSWQRLRQRVHRAVRGKSAPNLLAIGRLPG